MKKVIIKAGLSFVICAVLFIGVSYAYLSNKTEKTKSEVDEKKTDEPYEQNTPTNCGLLLSMPDDSGILFYLDFLRSGITVLMVEDCKNVDGEYKGYSVDRNVYADYTLVSGIIDRIGGVEIEESGEKVRLSGVQATEKLGSTTESVIKYQILKSTFDSISQNGLSRDDFVYIIENCDSTELSLTDCFYWSNYIKDMGANINIIT